MADLDRRGVLASLAAAGGAVAAIAAYAAQPGVVDMGKVTKETDVACV